MQGVLGGIAAVEVDRLNTAIVIAHVPSPVDRVQGYTRGREREEICTKDTPSAIVPYYRCVVLCCRNCNVVLPMAVANRERCDCSAVVRKGPDR